MHIFVHFIDKKQHCQIKWQMLVAKVSQAIEELAVFATKVDGHNITLIFYTLRNESLRPGDIPDQAVMTTGAEPGREHQHVIVALEAGLDHRRKVAALITRLVDRNTQRSKSW